MFFKLFFFVPLFQADRKLFVITVKMFFSLSLAKRKLFIHDTPDVITDFISVTDTISMGCSPHTF